MRIRSARVILDRHPRAGVRRWASSLAFLMAVAGRAGSATQAQGLVGGGMGPGGGVASPRGSAVTPSQSEGEPSGSERFGGLEGGEGRHRGTAGSASSGPTRANPGDPEESLLPAPLGASGTVGGEGVPGVQGPGILGGRMGRAAVPEARPEPGATPGDRSRRRRLSLDRRLVKPPESDPLTLSHRPRLEIPPGADDPGPEGGLTLDAAIDQLIRRNLDVCALKYEIPKAEADILTAGLRSNPIVYGDAQLVPYGHYSAQRPGGGGGQPQYDYNVSLPLDISGKRRARVEVARRAMKVGEAQLQDEIRKLIDQLHSAFVNVLAARDSLRYSEASLAGLERLLDQAEADLREAERAAGPEAKEKLRATRDARDELKAQERQAHYQVRQVSQTLVRATRTLAQILYLPPDEARSLRVRGSLREVAPVPDDAWLTRAALASRPDLLAYRLGTSRAEADVRLARANRLSDVYLVYQPFTFQDGRAAGVKGTVSYGVGVNAALPIFNRNQGNLARARWNAAQTRVEAQALEYQVMHDVLAAADDLRFSLGGVGELEREALPAARMARDDAYLEYRRDPSRSGDYLDEQREYHEAVQQYRNALIQMRQDMLDLNTAVGLRVMP